MAMYKVREYAKFVKFAQDQLNIYHLSAGTIKNYAYSHTDREVYEWLASKVDQKEFDFINDIKNDPIHQANLQAIEDGLSTPLMRERYKSFRSIAEWRDTAGNTWRDRMEHAARDYLEDLLTKEAYNEYIDKLRKVSIYSDPTAINKIFSYIKIVYPSENQQSVLSTAKWQQIFDFVGMKFDKSFLRK